MSPVFYNCSKDDNDGDNDDDTTHVILSYEQNISHLLDEGSKQTFCVLCPFLIIILILTMLSS